MAKDIFQVERCHSCGKTFIPAAQHLYKLIKSRKTYYYCSYTCWRKEGGDGGKRRKH